MKVGLALRQAKFLNGILYNSECWHGVSLRDIVRLERLDNALLRGILGAHSKTPVESLYQETGSISIRFILASRRILYLYNILSKDKNEILSKYYFAQKASPLPGDFYNLVCRDLQLLGLHMNEHEITSMNKSRFKRLVKAKSVTAAKNYFHKLQMSHSKVNTINYLSHSMQPYLGNPIFSESERRTLFGLRTHMIRDMRMNFKTSHKEYLCQLKCDVSSLDSQQHLLSCSRLRQEVRPVDCHYTEIIYIYIKRVVLNFRHGKHLMD